MKKNERQRNVVLDLYFTVYARKWPYTVFWLVDLSILAIDSIDLQFIGIFLFKLTFFKGRIPSKKKRSQNILLKWISNYLRVVPIVSN